MTTGARLDGGRTEDDWSRLLVEAITDYAIYRLDLDGHVVSWNAGAQRFKGYEAAEIIGQHFSRFYTEEDKQRGLPAMALQIAALEGRFEREGWRVRKDGGRFWAHVIIDPIHAPDGELLGFAKITRDLTDRRAAEEALRQTEQQFRLLVQGVTDYAIYMLDPTGRVTNWNAGAQRIKGYRPEEIIGQHFSRFYTDEDRADGLPDTALRLAREEGRFEREGWRRRKDGSRFWAHVIIDPIRDDRGEIIGFAKITRDVTERKEAQEALEAAREALFQSQKLDAIGQLTGGVAHDFNNLLMAIMGSLELLKKRLPEGDARAAALLDNAVQGAQRGAALTQRMLSFARKQELTLENVDVSALGRGMSDLLERSLGSAFTLEQHYPGDLPPARTDANQLETALLNLVINARDAMPEGGRICIEASAETVGLESDLGLAPGRYVRLAVVDKGAGMDEATLSRATEPFYTTKGVGKGTGLGLPMVHGLAAQSGGGLRLTSRPGRGTRAEIWLPVGDPALADPATPGEEPVTAAARPLSVLAVDDDNLVLMNTVAMLEDLGHRVVAAASGEAALAALDRDTFDVVLTDHVMPHMTGLQLSRAVRARRPGVVVILATGFAELEEDAGPDVMRLAKPYSQAELARALALATRPSC